MLRAGSTDLSPSVDFTHSHTEMGQGHIRALCWVMSPLAPLLGSSQDLESMRGVGQGWDRGGRPCKSYLAIW